MGQPGSRAAIAAAVPDNRVRQIRFSGAPCHRRSAALLRAPRRRPSRTGGSVCAWRGASDGGAISGYNHDDLGRVAGRLALLDRNLCYARRALPTLELAGYGRRTHQAGRSRFGGCGLFAGRPAHRLPYLERIVGSKRGWHWPAAIGRVRQRCGCARLATRWQPRSFQRGGSRQGPIEYLGDRCKWNRPAADPARMEQAGGHLLWCLDG